MKHYYNKIINKFTDFKIITVLQFKLFKQNLYNFQFTFHFLSNITLFPYKYLSDNILKQSLELNGFQTVIKKTLCLHIKSIKLL